MRSPKALAAAALLAAACEPAPGPQTICTADALRSALAAASPGSTVYAGSCRMSGAFLIPPGVTLAGAGRDVTILVATGDTPVLTVAPAPAPAITRITALTVEGGRSGVLARGAGTVVIESAQIKAERGVALAADRVTSLTLRDVSLEGAASGGATHGAVLIDVVAAEVTGLRVKGFSRVGAVLEKSTTLWRGGSASDNEGGGVLVGGGTATLEGVELCRVNRPAGAPLAFALAVTATATIETSDVKICGGDGIGLFHHSSSGRHLRLTVSELEDAAVWIQRSRDVELSGVIEDASIAGVAAIDSSGVSIHDARIARTKKAASRGGDGVELVRSTRGARLRGVVLDDNARAGVLIENTDEQLTAAAFERVRAVAPAAAGRYGAVQQGGGAAPGWDQGIAREGVTPDGDRSAPALEVLQPIDAEALPASRLDSRALDALLGL